MFNLVPPFSQPRNMCRLQTASSRKNIKDTPSCVLTQALPDREQDIEDFMEVLEDDVWPATLTVD